MNTLLTSVSVNFKNQQTVSTMSAHHKSCLASGHRNEALGETRNRNCCSALSVA